MKRLRSSVVICAALFLALALSAMALAGCGSTQKVYNDSKYGYSFSYPETWKVQIGTSDVTAGGAVAGNVGVYDPTGTKVGGTYVDLAMVMVYNLSFTVDDPWSSDIKTELGSVLASLENQTNDVKVEKDLTQTTAAELKGYEITYTFTKDSVPMRSTLYFLFDGAREYELSKQAALDTWDRAKPLLDQIVASFKPGPKTKK